MKRKSDEGFFTILGLIVLSLMLSFAQLLTQRAAALHKLAGAQEDRHVYHGIGYGACTAAKETGDRRRGCASDAA